MILMSWMIIMNLFRMSLTSWMMEMSLVKMMMNLYPPVIQIQIQGEPRDINLPIQVSYIKSSNLSLSVYFFVCMYDQNSETP